jgi:transcriptional regulator with XRE-family HTH domain
MAHTLEQELGKLPKKRRARVEARATEIMTEELSLRELRKALDRTQVELAKRMGVGQDTVSRCEQRTDLMVSTLARYVRAMGGTLSIVAEFPDRAPVRVRAFGTDLLKAPARRNGERSRVDRARTPRSRTR